MPDPAPLTMFDHIYVEEHPLVEAERAEFATYAASFEGSH
jgi:2-oxoisovalerate dehydrogenase E1 component alpha subunit